MVAHKTLIGKRLKKLLTPSNTSENKTVRNEKTRKKTLIRPGSVVLVMSRQEEERRPHQICQISWVVSVGSNTVAEL